MSQIPTNDRTQFDPAKADCLCDELVAVTNAAMARKVRPLELLAGHCLALHALMAAASTTTRPQTFLVLKEAVEDVLLAIAVFQDKMQERENPQ